MAPATAEFGSIWEDAANAPPQELPEEARQGRRLPTTDSSADRPPKADAKRPGGATVKNTLAGSLTPDAFSRRYADEKKSRDASRTPSKGGNP